MSLHMLPRHTPALPDLLADLGHPSTPTVARALGVTPRTVHRWTAAGHAPRPVELALYWVTPYGWDHIECEARRRLDDWRGLADARLRETESLRRELARVLAVGDFGSANQPLAVTLPPGAEVLPFSAARRPTGA